MANKNVAKEPEVEEFPVTIDEFLSEIPASRVESKAAFKAVMIAEGYTGTALRSEWNALYELLDTKPTAVSWKEWIGLKGGK